MRRDGHFVMRDFRAVALTASDRAILVNADGDTLVLPMGNPAEWSATWQRLAQPVDRDTLVKATRRHGIDAECLRCLVDSGHVLEAADEETLTLDRQRLFNSAPSFHLAARSPACDHLVFGCCGSVVAGLMAQTLLSFRHCGFQRQLDVVLTQTAARFLAPDLLESYGIRCWRDVFERKEGVRVPHVSLGGGADLIVVCPATAAFLGRLAHSLCTDLLTLCITASEAPVLVVPAMNDLMWRDAGVQRNLDLLRAAGRLVMEPTVIFGAADFAGSSKPMYGGHGSLWGGPTALMHAASAALEAHSLQQWSAEPATERNRPR
jgi:phosphopantothenoylcysteine decarboxylase